MGPIYIETPFTISNVNKKNCKTNNFTFLILIFFLFYPPFNVTYLKDKEEKNYKN